MPMTPPEFLAQVRGLQDAARAAVSKGGSVDVARLPAWANETEWFWLPQVRGLHPGLRAAAQLF